MRDPKRIPEVMNLIQGIWEKQPDTRFNQLIHNLQVEFDERNGMKYLRRFYEKDELEIGIIFMESSVTDLFYLEDEKFIEFLQWKLGDWDE